MASEFESDLQDTVAWGRKWFVDFNAGKTQQVLIDLFDNTGTIDVKMGGCIIEEKSSFQMLGSWIRALRLSVLLKLPPRKLNL